MLDVFCLLMISLRENRGRLRTRANSTQGTVSSFVASESVLVCDVKIDQVVDVHTTLGAWTHRNKMEGQIASRQF